MEQEYLKFLRENHPEYYADCLADSKHAQSWMTKRIECLLSTKNLLEDILCEAAQEDESGCYKIINDFAKRYTFNTN